MDGLDRERESLKGKKFTYLPMSVCVQTYAKESKIKRESCVPIGFVHI